MKIAKQKTSWPLELKKGFKWLISQHECSHNIAKFGKNHPNFKSWYLMNFVELGGDILWAFGLYVQLSFPHFYFIYHVIRLELGTPEREKPNFRHIFKWKATSKPHNFCNLLRKNLKFWGNVHFVVNKIPAKGHFCSVYGTKVVGFEVWTGYGGHIWQPSAKEPWS
jgi:hypothetical protein